MHISRVRECGGSRVITFPKQYLNYHKLNVGDYVVLVMDGDGIKVKKLNENDYIVTKMEGTER